MIPDIPAADHEHDPVEDVVPEDLPRPDDGTEPQTRLAEVRADHNVVAAFNGLESARAAVLKLERGGVAADAISLLGAREDPESDKIDDAQAEADLPARVVTGAATGAVGAGTIGALSALVIPGIGPVIAAGIWAVAGATAGGVIGGVSGMGGSEAWRQTFTAVESGNVAVGVHSNDPAVADLGYEVLADLDPLALNRFDG
jgi:hypothetical protein